MASYDAIINLKLKGLNQLKEVDRAITNITGGGRTGSGRGRGARQQLTVEKSLTDELKRQKALQLSINKLQTDPVSKSIRRNRQLQEKRRRVNLAERVSSRFLTGQRSEAATNIRVELKKRKGEAEALQAALKEMDQQSLHLEKARRKERRRSLSLGNDIVRQKTKEVELEVKARDIRHKGGPTGFKASQYGPREPGIFQSAQGDFSRLSDRQSRNVLGRRTFMNNRFARMGVPMPTKGFDAQSALISGAFPLLFGQGPVGAIAGGLGGGIGGMFGQMGGFAGGIAATALVQQIQQVIGKLGDLGKAMSPFVQDTNALIDSIGLAGTAEAKRIQIIEQLQGKQAAFNAAMQKMRETIGTEATKRLEEFGQKASLVGSEFKIAMLKMQDSILIVINAVDKLLGISKGAEKARLDRFIENSKNPSIVSRREELAGIRADKNARGRVKDPEREAQLEKELEQIANIGIALENQRVKMSEITLEHDKLVQKSKEEKDLKEAIKKLTETGMSQAVAKEVAQREQVRDKVLEGLDGLRDSLNIQRAQLTNEEEDRKTLEKIDKLLADILDKRKQILGETEKATKALQDQGSEIKKVKVTKEEIANLLANEMTNAIMGLIEGTKTLGEALAGIAKSLANMFLNAAFQNIFNQMFSIKAPVKSAQGSYSRAGGFKAFQYGGVVNQPTLGLMGEGGESEYVIPASKMSGAMARYSAGARGGAVIPGGSHESGTSAGGFGSTVVQYTGPVLNFNGDDYVPKSAVPDIINTAAKRGGEAGQARAFATLKNSRSQRATLGL